MDYPKSVPNVGLVNGKFVDENTTTGQVGSLIPSDWGNQVTDELLSVIRAGELEPSEADRSQLLEAIRAIIEAAIPPEPAAATENVSGVLKLVSDLLLTAGVDDTRAVTTKKLVAKLLTQGFTAFTTAGNASVYTLAPVPALSAYAPNQRFRVKFHVAGAGFSMLNVSGQGAKTLYQYDASGAKVAAVIAANQLADVEYDGTGFILLDPLPSTPVLPYNYFSGFVLANNVTAPTTTLDVAPGAARDTTDTVNLKLSGTLRGILQAAGGWAAGDNQNKLDTGVKAINAWYHVFVIRKISDGTADILYSLSPTAPTLPAGYAGFKRISSIRTDASGGIIPFFNVGRSFTWLTPILDLTASVKVAALYTLSVPTGVNVVSRFWISAYGSGDSGVVYTSPSANSITYAGTDAGYMGGVGFSTTSTDNSCSSAECIAENAQVRLQGLANARVLTYGWEEVA